MKKQLIYITASIVLSLSACNSKLEINPYQTIDATTALSSAQDVESAVIGAYAHLGNGAMYGTNFNLLAELQAAENYVTWRGTFAGYREVSLKSSMTNTNSEAERTWIRSYRAINTVNNVLESLPVVTDATLKGQLEGEARFIRGITYFELVRYYGLPWGTSADNSQLGVPLILTATKTAEQASTTAARNTVAQVYAQVIDDLTKAIALLPADNGTRADKYAAQAFLTRVYLQQSDFAKALTNANAIISSGVYRLNPSVISAFRNRNTQESIFEIQQNDQNNAGTSNDGLATFYASLPVNGVSVGRGDIQVNNSFRDVYEATDARRRELLYLGVKGGGTRTYSGKWTDFGANIPVIRLAEMYLVRAECNFRLGSTTGATPAADVNLIRARAGATLLDATKLTLADVLKERQLELAFEGLRIHDIKRLKQSTGTFAWNAPKLIFPIPKREVDANQSLVQNAEY
jgi:tetratricopeptide (TPR) repeat protein